MTASTIINSKFPIPNRGGFGSAGVLVFESPFMRTAFSRDRENDESLPSKSRPRGKIRCTRFSPIPTSISFLSASDQLPTIADYHPEDIRTTLPSN
jgi:hypothetical protein